MAIFTSPSIFVDKLQTSTRCPFLDSRKKILITPMKVTILKCQKLLKAEMIRLLNSAFNFQQIYMKTYIISQNIKLNFIRSSSSLQQPNPSWILYSKICKQTRLNKLCILLHWSCRISLKDTTIHLQGEHSLFSTTPKSPCKKVVGTTTVFWNITVKFYNFSCLWGHS